MPKVACIDVGTNSVLLLIAEGDTARELRAVVQRATITRLGEGVDRNRRLDDRAVARTLECLSEYALDLGVHKPTTLAALGTSALRDAAGSDAFRAEVRALIGVDLEIISGEREARLTFAGAVSGFTLDGPLLVADIGGGSTEIIQGSQGHHAASIESAASLDMGSVRFLERHLRSDPPTGEEVWALRMDVQRLLAGLPRPEAGAQVVGVAGTVTTLGAVVARMTTYDGARLHGARLTQKELQSALSELLALPLADRKHVPGLPPMRADAIIAGGVILDEVLLWANSMSLLISDRGVRWGRSEEMLGR